MSKNSKVVKRVIGGALIVVAGITAGYQYEFNKVKAASRELVVVAKKDINVGDELTKDNVSLISREKAAVGDNCISNLDSVLGSIAEDTIYKNENINTFRIVSEEEYEQRDLKLVSIKCKNDTLIGYDVKPYDVVDLLYYNSKGVYEGKVYMENQVVYDLKSAEGVSYSKRGDNYKATSALIWVAEDKAEDINAKQENGGYFKFQKHRENQQQEEK